MAVPRRAFALMLVLVATSATFALAMQGAVAMRTAAVEASILRDRIQARREAANAAMLTLATLTAGASAQTETTSFGGASSGSGAPAVLDNAELPEMPQEMKELFIGLMKKQDTPPDDGAGSGASPSAGVVVRRVGGAYTTLRRRGLPADAIRVPGSDRTFAVRLTDSAGGVNLNTASAEQLTRYFSARGVAEPGASTLADEILDWRDDDNIPRSRGAERGAYLRRDIVIRNGPLESIDELLYIPSMTRELLESVRDDLTLFGDGKVHAGSASHAVLLSLEDMTPATADRIIALRESGSLTESALHDALGMLSQAAELSLRIAPSPYLRVRVDTGDAGPAYRADAFISDDRPLRLFNLRLISR